MCFARSRAAEVVSRPFNAHRVVLEHLRVVRLLETHVGNNGKEVAEVHHFDGPLRDRVVLCLRRGERDRRLHLGAPYEQ